MSHQEYSALTWHYEHEPQEPQRLSWLQERDTEQSAPTSSCHTHRISRQLGSTADQRYDNPWDWLWDAWVRWGIPEMHQGGHASLQRWRPWCRPSYGALSCCKGICGKEDPHYRIKQSTRISCHRTNNSQPWFTSLEICWGFLTHAYFVDLVEAYVRQKVRAWVFCEKESMIRDRPMDVCMRNLWQKAEMGKKTGSESTTRFPQASCFKKNHAMCARNMGVHIWHTTLECLRYVKMGQEIWFPCSQERLEETSK